MSSRPAGPGVGDVAYDMLDSDAEFIAHAREDIPALLAAVRERNNTIARVRDIVESVHTSDGLDPDGYQVAGLIRAALDPQETE